jgi:hypothetical protein
MSRLSPSQQFVVIILGLAVLALVVSYLVSGPLALVAALTLCALVWILRPLLMPPGYGAMRIRMVSIVGVFGLAASHSFWGDLVNGAARSLAGDPEILAKYPWLAKVHFENEPSIAILVFVAVCVLVVNYFLTDRTIAGGHPVPIEKDFPQPSFAQKLESFRSALAQHLETSDRQANWSPDYYTELEAEVEIVATPGSSARKRITDLQSALRSDRKTRAFLVLGDPGGGKSVALRKLARDMLAEIGTTGRIPLYINLREWLPAGGRRATAWTEQSPPTMEELEQFVLGNLKARGDVFTEDFLTTYFRDLWQHGRLFFIFDSFDEIPELLDVNEDSWLLNCLSDLLSRFISSNANARGVLASRMFRRPTQSFLAQKILDIRPMSEERIVRALARYPAFTPELQAELFRDRHDLVPLARNPFLMALIGEWVNDRHALPATQAELYRNYLLGRLNKVADKMKRHGLTPEDVLRSATQIAWFVFESPAYGLEAPAPVIGNEPSIEHASATMDILSYARIARVTPGDTVSFSFVHRRFLEYLVTTRLLDQPEDIPIQDIPTDSRGRDALVLYAQLCSDEAAEQLAMLCWSEITQHFHRADTRLRAIHSLRFLTDAFRSRRPAIRSFSKELAEFIDEHVASEHDLVQAKICLEATGLLDEASAVPILQLAMSGQNSWLQETAFRACRHLPQLPADLLETIHDYLIGMPLQQFWQSRRTLIFSLSLSDSLKSAHSIALWRRRNTVLSGVAFMAALLLATPIVLAAMLWGAGMSLLEGRSASLAGAAARNNRALFSPQAMLLATRLAAAISLLVVGVLFSTGLQSLLLPEDHLLLHGHWHLLPSDMDRTVGVLAVVCGLGILDWLLVARAGSIVQVFGMLSMKEKLVIAGSVAVAGLVAGGIFWLGTLLPEWVKTVLMGLLGIPIAAIGIYVFGRDLYSYVRSRRAYGRLVVGGKMSRQEIARSLGTLDWTSLRLKFVRQMASQKTTAYGDWPPDFKLAVSGDEAITELAKLEEHWLRLDR